MDRRIKRRLRRFVEAGPVTQCEEMCRDYMVESPLEPLLAGGMTMQQIAEHLLGKKIWPLKENTP